MNLRRFGAWAGRSLSTRIVIVFLGLLVAIQAASFMAISLRMQRYTQGKLPATFAAGEGVLVHLLAQQGDELTKDASLLAADYGFRAAVQSNDAPTIASALANHGARIGATESALLDTDFTVLAFSDASESRNAGEGAGPELAGLIRAMALRAARDGRATAVALLRGRPHQLVLIPMKAPTLVGWVMMGFPIAESLAGNLKLLTSLDMTLVSRAPAAPGWTSALSTLGGEGGRALAVQYARADPAISEAAGEARTPGQTEVELGDDRLGVRAVRLGHEASAEGRAELVALLSLSVAKAGRPPQEVHLALILATLLGVVLFGVGSVITARRVTTPLRALAVAAERLGDGEYGTPIAGQERDDEVGELAKSFERMRISVVAKQQQLVQSEKLASIGQLAAGVAHEINNPMGFVSSNFTSLEDYLARLFKLLKAYQAEEHGVAGTPGAQRLKRAREEAEVEYLQEDIPALMAESREGIDRVLKIVQDLKDFSHMDMRRDWEFADLHAGLDSTLNIVSNEIRFRADVVKAYGELPKVECVPSELNQVFLNLLVNAAHAMGKQRGTINLASGASDGEAWVTVTDNGSGIPAELQKRIFDPFFTTKPVGTGTGLGLSLSYGIVKKHGGRIEVDSEPGRGTSFRVVIPLRRALAA